MRAIGYQNSLPIDDENSLRDIERPDPDPSTIGPHDLIVEVAAVSVNPVDTKVRRRAGPGDGEDYKVLGYDASGTVKAAGSKVTLFQPGDAVYYAGAIGRPGTNSERHVVDERIVGTKPSSLSHTEAAALPLTTITAWELLFDGMHVLPKSAGDEAAKEDTLLIIGGAGGVGSILIQIAKILTNLTVVATASRDETRAWCKDLGADHIINHHGDMKAQLEELGLSPRYVASLTATADNFTKITDLIAPRGIIAMIDDPGQIDVSELKEKALTLHWEFMFTRPAFETDDMIEQHRLLSRIGDLIDDKLIRSTYNHNGGSINAENLRKAHALQESGKAIGKTVLTGF